MKPRLTYSYKPANKWLAKRRGRPRKFRGWSAIVAITILTIVASFLTLGINHIDVKMAKADTLQAELSTIKTQKAKVEVQKAQIASENAQLKEKLTDASLVTADPKTKAIVLYYIHEYFGQASDQAIRVFTCESGLSPNTIHVNKPGLGYDSGVAQINSTYHQANFERMFPGIAFDIGTHDIQMNLQYAKHLYEIHGNTFSSWVCATLLSIK